MMIGCTIDGSIGDKYTKQLNFGEFLFAGERPKPKTLARIRTQLPQDFACSLVAGDADLTADPKAFAEAANALRADVIVLATGTETTPGQRARNRMRAWIEAQRDLFKGPIAWQPGGLWEAQDSEKLANTLSVARVIDPRDEPFEGETTIHYGRIVGIGARRRVSEFTLSEVAARMLATDKRATTYVSIHAPNAVRLATRLQQLTAAEPNPDTGLDRS